MKIIKIAATRCHILQLKCTNFDFGWGSAPNPAVGAYSAPPNPLSGFKAPTSKGRRRDGKGRDGRGVEGMGMRGRGRNGMAPERRDRRGKERRGGKEGFPNFSLL